MYLLIWIYYFTACLIYVESYFCFIYMMFFFIFISCVLSYSYAICFTNFVTKNRRSLTIFDSFK